MKKIWNHEANISNDLMKVTFAKEDVLNKLVDTASDDMKKRCSDDT